MDFCFHRKVVENLRDYLPLDVVACYRKTVATDKNTDLTDSDTVRYSCYCCLGVVCQISMKDHDCLPSS